MKLIYRTVLMAIFAITLSSPLVAQDTLLVPWLDEEEGQVIRDNLRTFIANDTDPPATRVYKLERGGLYWIVDPIQHTDALNIVGEKVPVSGDDYGPAIIQRVNRENGTAPGGTMFESNGDLTLKNVWIMGQTEAGVINSYEPMKLLKDGGTYIFDGVIFDRNDWHHLGPDAGNMNFYVRNCVFRNIFGPTQRWEGLGVRFEVGADTVVFENNTFFNIGFTPFQSEAQPMNYFLCNHNTFVNIGRQFQAGNAWIEALVTNNLFVNYYWGGQPFDQYQNNIVDPYDGFFSIGQLPSAYGTDFGRQILVEHNAYWLDPDFVTWHKAFTPDTIRTQPFINDTTQGWFDFWPNMVYRDNWEDNPGLITNPNDVEGFVENMITAMTDLYNGVNSSVRYYYDPGRPADNLANIWPLPEDFSYSNSTLQTAGTDGLPLGDLNWFPAAKATYDANRDQYISDIENRVSAPILAIIETIEAEDATTAGGAEIVYSEGLLNFDITGGWFQWTFDVPSAGQYDFDVYTNMNGNDIRGQRFIINGTSVHDCFGYGEYIWDAVYSAENDPCENPHVGLFGAGNNDWAWTRLIQDEIAEAGAFTLNQTANILRLESSWGFQRFGTINVLEAGTENVVIALEPEDATYGGAVPLIDNTPAPSGFEQVSMGSVGASISFNVDVNAGQHMLRIFYNGTGTAAAQLSVDGTIVDGAISLVDTGDVFTAIFSIPSSGSKTFLLEHMGGGAVEIDYVQPIEYTSVSGLKERNEKPEGFALKQNYPNPFNPSTNIQFSIGEAAKVKLTVFNILGQEVTTLVNNRLNRGSYTFDFNGSQYASGVYIYRLEAGDFVQQKKMILIK